ncbi:MAG: hypothetical protein RI564_06845 [Gracilimonas sp.]|nr:hypothetical protein [Gracilimonas sp.]
MRTTVDLPDDLMKKAKMKAIEEGITLKDLLKRSIEKELNSSKINSKEMPWKAFEGTVDLKDYKPEDSAFNLVFGKAWMPEAEFFGSVNEPDSKGESD